MTIISTYQEFLYDMRTPVSQTFAFPLLEILEREAAKEKAADVAYLATLSTVERKRVLTQRRIDLLQRRLDNWWEENMAWRFRPYPPDADYDW